MAAAPSWSAKPPARRGGWPGEKMAASSSPLNLPASGSCPPPAVLPGTSQTLRALGHLTSTVIPSSFPAHERVLFTPPTVPQPGNFDYARLAVRRPGHRRGATRCSAAAIAGRVPALGDHLACARAAALFGASASTRRARRVALATAHAPPATTSRARTIRSGLGRCAVSSTGTFVYDAGDVVFCARPSGSKRAASPNPCSG